MMEQIHVINLDASVERFDRFRESNSHLEGVTRVSGVDGIGLDRSKLVKEGIITSDLPYKAGSLGCSLSHIRLWEKAVAQRSEITVFEDDVICVQGLREKARSVFSQVTPNWDIIIWGFNYSPLFVWADFRFTKAKLEFYDRKEPSELLQGNFLPVPIKIAHSFGLFGYTVSAKGARTLLDYCLPLKRRYIPFPGTSVVIEDTSIDCSMCGIYSSMEAFICVPPLVLHDFKQPSVRIGRDSR
jgi:GR25 family glycosyltransferase involved in LPS biosynthesis